MGERSERPGSGSRNSKMCGQGPRRVCILQHDGFAQRIDGRVGDLREALAEEGVERTRRAGQGRNARCRRPSTRRRLCRRRPWAARIMRTSSRVKPKRCWRRLSSADAERRQRVGRVFEGNVELNEVLIVALRDRRCAGLRRFQRSDGSRDRRRSSGLGRGGRCGRCGRGPCRRGQLRNRRQRGRLRRARIDRGAGRCDRGWRRPGGHQ